MGIRHLFFSLSSLVRGMVLKREVVTKFVHNSCSRKAELLVTMCKIPFFVAIMAPYIDFRSFIPVIFFSMRSIYFVLFWKSIFHILFSNCILFPVQSNSSLPPPSFSISKGVPTHALVQVLTPSKWCLERPIHHVLLSYFPNPSWEFSSA